MELFTSLRVAVGDGFEVARHEDLFAALDVVAVEGQHLRLPVVEGELGDPGGQFNRNFFGLIFGFKNG